MNQIEIQLRAITPAWGQRHIEETLNGNTDAAFSLFCSMNDTQRAAATILLFQQIPVSVYQVILGSTWNQAHRHIIAAAKEAFIEIADLFQYAAFPVNHLPERIRVWRGSSALTIEECSSGNSWTTDRDTACWFAMRFAEKNGSPLVIAADIHRDDVFYSSNERNENEVLLFDTPDHYWIDGSPEDWMKGCERYEVMKDA